MCFGRRDKNTDSKKGFLQCIQCQVEEGCLSMKCLVFRLSNLSPDLCCSLVLFVSASISLSLSYLNVVFSMCCPVTHRSPTLALAPLIRAEKDRWRRGLGTLSARSLWHHRRWRTDWRAEAWRCKQIATDSKWWIENLHSTSAFVTISLKWQE